MNIGSALREVRKKQGISQIELSALSGVSQTTLSQVESGIRKPNAKTLKAICNVLNVPEPMIYVLGTEPDDIPMENKDLYDRLFPAIHGLVLQLVSKAKP